MYDPSGRFTLSIHPRGRRPADEYYHNGITFIEGRDGSNYTLRFENRTSNRVQVVFSVDGLDVLRGLPAGPNSDGYVVDANSAIEVPGWKVNGAVAAEFEFAGVGKSYSSKMGQGTANAGVIGAMVFREKAWTQAINPPWVQQHYLSHTDSWAGTPLAGSVTASMVSPHSVTMVGVTRTASSTVVNNEVGTGFGSAVDFSTTQTSFVREDAVNPDAIMAIYYDSARGLERRGIVLRKRHTGSYSNNPFPAYVPGAKPPGDWQG
jgi:hypothetical protein